MIKLKQVIHYTDTNSVEATWVYENDVSVKCHSYADVQMDMLRADLGSDAAEFEPLMALVESGIKPAPPPILYPVSCSPWQMRKALNAQGLRQQVEQAVAESWDQVLKDGWEFANEFRSDDPFVIGMGQSMGKTEEETRALIEFATTL